MYGYQYPSDQSMRVNRWGSNTLEMGPLVVFKKKSDLEDWIGDLGDRKIIRFNKLWGIWDKDRWLIEISRESDRFSECLFASRKNAEKAIVGNKGLEVREFYTRDGDVKMENTEIDVAMSPLKRILRSQLLIAVSKLDSDWGNDVNDFATIVDAALNRCDFKDEDVFRYVEMQAGQDAVFPAITSQVIEAFVICNEGKAPERVIEGSDVHIPTFKIGNAISWDLNYMQDRRYDVLERAIQMMAQGYIDKVVQEQNRIVGTAAASKNKVCCETGQTTVPRALHEMISQMKMSGRTMTDVYVTPEAYADLVSELRYPGYEQDSTIFCGVNVHVEHDRVDEMERTHYDSYSYKVKKLDDANSWQKSRETLRQKLIRWITFAPRHVQCIVEDRPLMFGIDKGDDLNGFDQALLMPFRDNRTTFFYDETMRKQRREGIYGWIEMGFGCLDPRAVVAGAYDNGQKRVIAEDFVENRLSKAAAFVLPVKRTGGVRGWIKRFW